MMPLEAKLKMILSSKRNKVIYTSIADCGLGKTISLAKNITKILCKGNVIIAAPTTALCEQIGKAIQTNATESVPVTVIHSKQGVLNKPTATRVETSVKGASHQKVSQVVITTHETLLKIDPHLLVSWCVVVDEVPKLLEVKGWEFYDAEYDLISNGLEIQDGGRVVGNDQLQVIVSGEDSAKDVNVPPSTSKLSEPIPA